VTRDDIAHLVIRTFALWLASTGLATLGSAPWMIPGPGGLGAIVAIALVFLAAAASVWFLAPALARAMVSRPDRDVPFAFSARGVPALASFVVGLFMLAAALPQAVSWLAVHYLRRTADAGVFGSSYEAIDRQTAGLGAEILARVVMGVALLALSRRPGIWAMASDVDADDAPAETE
jgi:hypothetical protein